jgi:hypothetical protein
MPDFAALIRSLCHPAPRTLEQPMVLYYAPIGHLPL